MLSVIHRTFNDPRDYEHGVRMAQVSNLVVSERGVFDAALTAIDAGCVWLQGGSDNLARTVQIAIESPRRSIAFLPDWQVAPTITSGTEFGPGDVVSFGRNTSHFQRTFGPFRWASMSLPPENFEEAVETIIGRDVVDPSKSLRMKPSAENLYRLRQVHREVNQMAFSGETALDHPEVVRSMEQFLTVAIVACFADGTDEGRGSGWHRHQQIMARFREWLDNNNNRAVYLQEVCAALNVSAPTLRRCCEEHLGMSPMHYLWLRRMNLARRDFQQRPSPASVTVIAMKYGFWHLGRFANEYRSLFGETPSATLARYSPH